MLLYQIKQYMKGMIDPSCVYSRIARLAYHLKIKNLIHKINRKKEKSHITNLMDA